MCHPPKKRKTVVVPPPQWMGNQSTKGPLDRRARWHIEPMPLNNVHRMLQAWPSNPGLNSSEVLSARDWVEKVTPQIHFDKGWQGVEPMLAPEGDARWEYAWRDTLDGVTLLIPSYEQLRGFESTALKELSEQYLGNMEVEAEQPRVRSR